MKVAVRNIMHDFIYGNAATMVLRVALGAMFLFSGMMKALDPESFARIIALYDLLPSALVPYAAIVIPYLELVLGLAFVVGYKIKGASILSVLLMIVFSAGIAVNLYRGNNFECGCFELHRLGLGLEERISYALVARDLLLMICFIVLFVAKKHVLSVEHYLEKRGLRKLR